MVSHSSSDRPKLLTIGIAFPNFRNLFVASGAAWLVANIQGQLVSWRGSVVGVPVVVDHVLELSMVVAFFTGSSRSANDGAIL